MKLYPGCGYYNEERDDEYAPDDECESCYRYDICKKCFIKEKGILDPECCYLKISAGNFAPYDSCQECHMYIECKERHDSEM